MRRYIYADNAATTKLDTEAFEAMKPYLLDEYGNASQPYSFSRNVRKALREAREVVAASINAEPEEIFFTSGGTESDNWAIKESFLAHNAQGELITSQIEHHAVLNSAAALERRGIPVAYLPVDTTGTVLLQSLTDSISNRTNLVSVMFANNEMGTIQPVRELAAIAHAHGALFHTDAVQAIGHVKIDVKELDVDMLSASAHKFNGPKGIGFLYIKRGRTILPLLNGGSQESSLRSGTENVAAIVGMSVALFNNCKTLDVTRKNLLVMEQILLRKLDSSGLKYVRNGSRNHVPGNLSLSFKGFEGEALLHRLDLKGICVSTGSACDSEKTQVSHVLRAMNLEDEYALGTIRVSLGKLNTEMEASTIAEALISIVGKS